MSFGAQCVNYHSFLIPIINYSTDIKNPSPVYLLEEGFEMWIITVQNSVKLTPELLNLFSNLKPLLDWYLCFRFSLDIIDSYVVLDANLLFQVVY